MCGVCVCVRERERERERAKVRVCFQKAGIHFSYIHMYIHTVVQYKILHNLTIQVSSSNYTEPTQVYRETNHYIGVCVCV